MSCSSSSHTAHDASESGHTASLSRQPIQDFEEDPSEDEVNSIHSPTPTPTSVPSLPTRQGPPFRHTARMRVISPARVRDCRIRVECQAELLLEMSDIVGRLTHEITSSIYTAQKAIMVGRRAWYLGLSAVRPLMPTEGIREENPEKITKGVATRHLCLAIPRSSMAMKVLLGRALTWWNTQVQTHRREAALQLTWATNDMLVLTCFECGSRDHLRNTCPKLNRALGQGWNRPNPGLAIEGNTKQRNNDNKTRRRAFIMGANEAGQNPNVMT
ncbi:reverse transcriptase domain-containing protein, partial [Tanacetum coccineum]